MYFFFFYVINVKFCWNNGVKINNRWLFRIVGKHCFVELLRFVKRRQSTKVLNTYNRIGNSSLCVDVIKSRRRNRRVCAQHYTYRSWLRSFKLFLCGFLLLLLFFLFCKIFWEKPSHEIISLAVYASDTFALPPFPSRLIHGTDPAAGLCPSVAAHASANFYSSDARLINNDKFTTILSKIPQRRRQA